MFGRRNQSKTAETAILRQELSAQREATHGLLERYEVQVRNVRTAVKAVGKAREERDQYRRVLAASIATDHQRESRVKVLEEERLRLEGIALAEGKTASEEEGRRRELKGRVERLELRLTDELAARERVLGDAADRAWAEREASRSDVVRLIASHRSEVTDALEATRSELERLRIAQAPKKPSPGVHSLRRVRVGALIGLSLLATLAALALIPPTVLAIGDPERALFVHMASGLGPWQLILSVVLFCAAAVGLLSWALRDMERLGGEPAGQTAGQTAGQAAGQTTGKTTPGGSESSAKRGLGNDAETSAVAPQAQRGPRLRNVKLTPKPSLMFMKDGAPRDARLAENGRSG